MDPKRSPFLMALLPVISLLAPIETGAQTIDLGALSQNGLKELRLYSWNGVSRPLPGTGTIPVTARQYVIGKISPVGIPAPSSRETLRVALPYRLYSFDATNHLMELQPLIDIAGGGMRYESKDVGFHATLNITVIDMKGPMEVKPLPFPVRLLVSADVDRTDPSGAFDITETFSFHEVDLYAMSPANTVRVRVLPSFLSTPVQLDMKVIRLPINIYVTPARIQGFGLQTASITVEVDGLRDPTTATIVLNTDRGRLEKTQMALDSNGIATVGIRSLSIGEAKITARYSPAGTAEATLTFDVPWLFAGAAVVGGLFGSGIRLLVERKKKLSGRVISCRLLRGTLLGILVAAAYSVGVNLSGINFPATWSGAEEGFTFVIAGLVAHAGRIKIPSSPT